MTRLARFVPDGVAARTAATVILALLLTQVVSGLIYLTDRGHGQPVHNLRVLTERVAAITRLVEDTAPERRDDVVRALDDPVLGVRWSEKRPKMGREDAFPLQFLRRRLRLALDGRGGQREIHVWVRVARPFLLGPPPPTAPPTVPQRGDGMGDGMGEGRGEGRGEGHGEGHGERMIHGDLFIAVGLTDDTWLVFTTGDPADGPFRLLRFAAWIGGVMLVVGGLSWWAARRLTAPLAHFAAAAERLGVDPDSPALAEDGPRELRAATRAFNTMRERLSRFVADRTQMVAAMSHDLRTPLTRLRLRAELVEDDEQRRKMLSDLDEMQAMIDATLAFARDDAKREPRVPLDLAALCQSLCDDRVDAGADATYEGPRHGAVNGRPVALRRALANLIDNAIAYGGRARVTLRMGTGPKGVGAVAAVMVEDDGPGIPPDQLERVFQPFYRVESSRSRDTGGVGLGLSTARTIVRGHGGDVTLSNREGAKGEGGGLTVTVTLPV